SRISSAQRCRIRPTIMQVRDATVGPLSGTTPVSAAWTSMASYGTPSVSATICACIVRVPWPISVLATRIRAPRPVSASDAFEATLHLPPAGDPRAGEEERHPEAAIAAGERFAATLEVGSLHGFAQHPQRAAVAAEPLTGGGRVAGPQRIDRAQPRRIDPEL